MRGAIGYALNWPERRALPVERLDFAALGRLDFAPGRPGAVPGAAAGAARCWRLGGLAGAVFNAAKEAALDAFLAGRIGFLDMAVLVEHVLEKLGPDAAAHRPRLRPRGGDGARRRRAPRMSEVWVDGLHRKVTSSMDAIASIPLIGGVPLDGAAVPGGARASWSSCTSSATTSSRAGAASAPRSSRSASARCSGRGATGAARSGRWRRCRSAATSSTSATPTAPAAPTPKALERLSAGGAGAQLPRRRRSGGGCWRCWPGRSSTSC